MKNILRASLRIFESGRLRLELLSVNYDDIPVTKEEMKHGEFVTQISKHHLITLTETRTNKIQRLLQHLPGHMLIGQTYIPTGHQGLKGYGVAVLASNQVTENFHSNK
eukprot:1137264-Pelagomonas_calceolata.AAC.1